MAKGSTAKKTEETKNEVAPVETRSLATPEDNGGLNYFESYGNQVTPKAIVGQLLKFSKGDYLAGQDDEEIPVGTKLVVNMDQLMVGWIKWVDNKPEQQIMGPLAEGFQPPKRNTLGDDDQDLWEEDTQGKKRDPWQFSNYVIMKPVGKPGTEDNLYTFTTSSKGGLSALGDLCKYYGRNMRTRPDEYPIVTLQVNSYNHPNKEFGRIKTPKFETNDADWESKSVFAQTEAPAKGKKK